MKGGFMKCLMCLCLMCLCILAGCGETTITVKQIPEAQPEEFKNFVYDSGLDIQLNKGCEVYFGKSKIAEIRITIDDKTKEMTYQEFKERIFGNKGYIYKK